MSKLVFFSKRESQRKERVKRFWQKISKSRRSLSLSQEDLTHLLSKDTESIVWSVSALSALADEIGRESSNGFLRVHDKVQDRWIELLMKWVSLVG